MKRCRECIHIEEITLYLEESQKTGSSDDDALQLRDYLKDLLEIVKSQLLRDEKRTKMGCDFAITKIWIQPDLNYQISMLVAFKGLTSTIHTIDVSWLHPETRMEWARGLANLLDVPLFEKIMGEKEKEI